MATITKNYGGAIELFATKKPTVRILELSDKKFDEKFFSNQLKDVSKIRITDIGSCLIVQRVPA